MTEFAQVAVAVFSLLSLGQSAPVTSCDNLLQQNSIQGRDQFLGTWYYIGESTNIIGSKLLTQSVLQSSWWNITAGNKDNDLISFQNQKMFGSCFSLTYTVSVENNTLVMVNPYPSSAFLLNTGCLDCLVVYSNYTIGSSQYKGMQLMSRRTEISAPELEEFKKQVECLKLPEPAILDSEKGFCPDPTVSTEIKSLDLSSAFNSDALDQLDKILKHEKAVEILTETISFISKTSTSAKTVGN
nr:uncharacterized protein LOC107382193 [Nothobranchius furzeri]